MPHQPPALLTMIRELIAIPSVSSVNPRFDQGNRVLIERLAQWLDDLGFAVEIQPLPGQPYKANLIATLGSGPGGLVLSGHTDTVPYDEGRWRHDPFAAVVEHERIYGLGAADMKSFLAIAVEAVRGLRAADLKQPLVILATADEESSMAGAQALVEAGRPLGRFAVIGEPTGLRPVRMHKGIMMEAIRLTGRSGHSSNPALGVSALEGMHTVIGELLAWRQELAARYRNPLFAVAIPTLNLGHIHGGDNPNRICAECELHIDIRPLPGMLLGELREALHTRLARVLEGRGLQLAITPLFGGLEAMETPADSPIVRAAEALTGHSAGAVAFGTEGPYLRQMGLETVILGPGHIDQAHQPDEYLELAMLAPALRLLRELLWRFCLTPAETRPPHTESHHGQ
ncbi:MAG TPA: acetylornithine deacetylase [Candidatus Competibacteraceae bacterium]|nr:acetylornithine deacetylase [Candidatus Competibacteraceae bacterium]